MASRKKPSNLTLTVPSVEPLAETRRKEADAIAKQLKAEPIVVSDDADAEAVGEMISELGRHKAELTRMLKSITDPINAGLKQARGLFNPAIKAIEVPERMLRAALGDYRVRQLEAAEAAQEATAAALEAGDEQALVVALNAPTPEMKDDATTTRYKWVVAHIDESKLTRDWLTADVAKLNALCRATSGKDPAPEVKGVTFKREATVVRR